MIPILSLPTEREGCIPVLKRSGTIVYMGMRLDQMKRARVDKGCRIKRRAEITAHMYLGESDFHSRDIRSIILTTLREGNTATAESGMLDLPVLSIYPVNQPTYTI
jgi:hypothetical protein